MSTNFIQHLAFIIYPQSIETKIDNESIALKVLYFSLHSTSIIFFGRFAAALWAKENLS